MQDVRPGRLNKKWRLHEKHPIYFRENRFQSQEWQFDKNLY